MQSENQIVKEEDFLLLEYQENILYFDGFNLEELLKKYRTPLFIFSQRILENQYKKIRKTFSSLNIRSLKIAFSVKSNPLPEVAQTFMEQGAYFEVTSLGEIKHVIANGGVPKKIIYTNIVKNISTIKYCLEKGVELIAVDSWSDIRNIEKACKELQIGTNVLLRVNPGTLLDDTLFSCTGVKSKIGVLVPENLDEESHFKSILNYCIDSEWLIFRGLHVHLGSQIINLDQYRKGMKKISLLISQIKKIGIPINILDIGGGFPIYYGDKKVPNIKEFKNIIQEVFNKQLESLEVIIESGRYLTAPAGILAFQIPVIKERESKMKIACVNGSFFNTIPDVIIADWHFPIKKVKQDVNTSIIPYQIVGSTNDTLDYYKGHNKTEKLVSLYKLEEEDYIVFLQTGAYSISFNSTYCMEERPLVHFILNTRGK